MVYVSKNDLPLFVVFLKGTHMTGNENIEKDKEKVH